MPKAIAYKQKQEVNNILTASSQNLSSNRQMLTARVDQQGYSKTCLRVLDVMKILQENQNHSFA